MKRLGRALSRVWALCLLCASAANADVAQPPPQLFEDQSLTAQSDPNQSSSDQSTADQSMPEQPTPGRILLSPDEGARGDIATRLASGRFRFCSEESYRLWEVDKDRLCPHLGKVAADCPGLVAACARPAWDEATPEPSSPGWFFELTKFLGNYGGQLLRALFWLAVALGAIFLLRGVLTTLRRDGSSEAGAATAPTLMPTVDVETAGQPTEVLLARAAEYLESGDPRRALHFAYAALLSGLDHAGLVRVHRALTSGDYRRSLARSGRGQAAGTLLWDLDLARFRHVVDSTGAHGLTSRVREVLAALGAVLLFLAPSGLLGCSPGSDAEGPMAPTAPRGYALFEELASTRFMSFTRRLRRVTELPEGTSSVLVVDAHLRKLEWETLSRFVTQGGRLVVAGSPDGLADAFGLGPEPSDCTGPIEVSGIDVVTPDTTGVSLVALGADDSEGVLATCGASDFARFHRHGAGRVTLIGDASIFDNTSLALGDNASFVLHLFGGPQRHVEFIGPWTGTGAFHPMESIARSTTGPWLLHLLGMLALLAWSRGRRFGAPRPPAPSKRRSWIEHAQALASHYERQGDTGAALSRYASWALSLLGKRSGSSNRDLRALAEALVSKQGVKNRADEAAEVHHLLLRARAGAELGGDKAKLLRGYRVLRTMVSDVAGRR